MLKHPGLRDLMFVDIRHCYGLNMTPPSPPNSHVEVLTPKITVFGDRVFEEINAVK